MQSSPIDPQAMRRQWLVPAEIAFLNHGSFGPSPRCVIAARGEEMEALESNPMDFFVRRFPGELETVRGRLAEFVGTVPENLGFVANATTAMNIVAESLQLQPGDEILANDHEYGAVLRIWERVCERTGARLVVAPVPTPIASAEGLMEPILAAITPRTRLLILSHITSPTAIIFPVEALCREARRRGIVTCIDGPHAPAMIPLELDRLDCDYYMASCHKWLCAPFGSGFLYLHPRVQGTMQPAVLSWGRLPDEARRGWRYELEWPGTYDPSPFLAIPTAIEFLESIGMENFRDYTHSLAQYARQQIGNLTGLEPLTPDSRDWYGSMVAVPLPDGESRPLQAKLWEKYQIEIPVIAWQGRRLIRVSCHVYTSQEEVDRLLVALKKQL